MQLPSGSILGLGLITVVAGLLELQRRRRRQHRVPSDPSDPDPSAPRPPAAVRAAEEAWLAARRRLTQPDDTDGDPNDDLGDDPNERGTYDAGEVEDRYFTDPATDLGLDPGHGAGATGVSGGPVRRLRVQVPAPAPDLPADDVVTRRRGLSPGQFPAPSLLALLGPPAAAPLAWRAWSGGAGLVGPGAAGAARAVMARLLTAVGPMGGELVTTEAAVTDLLPADAAEGFAATPGVTVFGTLRDALAACEAELLARARWLFDHEDLASHRNDPTALPVPALLLVAHAPEATPADAPLAAHTDAVLRLGARRELGAVLLGAWPATTLAVSADGTLSEPSQSEAASVAGTAPVGRVELLTASDAADLLAGLVPPLRDALDVVDPTTLLPPFDTGATESAVDESPDAEEPAARSPGEPGDSGAAHADGSGRGAAMVPVARSRAAQAPDTPVLEVAVFGRVRLLTTQDRREVTGVRAKIRNLLALLAVHPDGLTSDQVGDALWPEAPPDRIPGRLSATLALTRRLLRESAHATAPLAAPSLAGTSSGGAVRRNRVPTEAGRGRVDLVPMVDGRYQLHPTLIGSDYRRFTDALAAAAEARRAGNDSSRRVALRTVADLYRGHDGEILGGVDYSWAIPIRERLRRQATDSLATLASLLSATPNTADPRIDYRAGEDGPFQVDDGTRDASTKSSRPAAFPQADEDTEDRPPDAVHHVAVEEALEALEQAIDVDPYDEDLYRQVMRLHAAAGRREDIYQTLRLLEARLLDIDAEPDPATSALVTQLLRTSPARPAQGTRSDRTGPARGTSRSAERG